MSRSAAQLAAWDHTYLWHPFTQMRDWLAEEPLIIAAGEGNYLVDIEGRRYLDGVSSLWCNVHGHRRRELDEALEAQVDHIAHSTLLGLASVPSIELAKRLVDIIPRSLTRVFYSDAGATAVEIALKMAFQYWHLRGDDQRTRFASLVEGYHGDTIGAVSVGYSESFHRPFKPLLFDCHKLNPPHVYRWQRGLPEEEALNAAVGEAKALLERHGRQLAALIIEPLMQGAAGMWAQPPGYVRALRALTREHGVLLICDEVATGFGRTGRMFAVEHDGVEPDLMCVGKGLSGGYLPLAATFATEEIFAAFLAPYEDFKTFFHGHTYTGNALACAVALANLAIFEKENVVGRTAERAAQMRSLLQQHVVPLANVGEVRQWGLMVGIEIVRERRTKTLFETRLKVPQRIVAAARRAGVIIRPLGNVMILMPPLSINPTELETLCHVTGASIQAAAAS
jgi:adenosylmethionine-8-amino-7-oxononanoate aminotransferase